MSRNHPYPELQLAEAKVEMALFDLQAAMERAFPVGCRVRINHHRGPYTARVTHVGARQCRLMVETERTGKRTYAYPSMRNGIYETDEPCVVRLED